MKTISKVACLLIAVGNSLVFGQGPTWTTSTIQAYNGYDYELWNQNNSGTVSMNLTGDNGQGANAKGGTFTAQWSGTENVLFRSGKKWGTSSSTTPASLGNAVVDFAATWSSGDNVKMLGVYGWAYYPSGSVPTQRENGQNATFSDQIEYYIIQDRGSYNPATNSDLCKSASYGEGTIDGVLYEFRVCDRINQPMLTGNGNFKQYFSIPKSTGSHRTSGLITVSKHFSEWERVGMKMSNCRLYEIAMKVESYTGSSKNSSGNATVTKNLLTTGGTLPSSSSGGTPSSSSAGNPVACNYQTSFCGGMSFANVFGNTNSIPSDGSCFYIGDFEVIQPSLNSTISINGVENTCGADWDACPYNDRDAAVKVDGGFYVFVKTGTVNDFENNGWQGIVAKAKPNCTSFSDSSPIKSYSPLVANKTFHYYSLKGIPLGATKPTNPGVYIEKHGSNVQKIVVK